MEARVERACIHRVSGDERERKEEVLVTYLGLGVDGRIRQGGRCRLQFHGEVDE